MLSETEQVASAPARMLAEQFAFAYLKCGHKACRLNPNEKGSLKDVANYINGSWSATNVSQHKSSALGVMHSLLSLGKVLDAFVIDAFESAASCNRLSLA